MPTLIARTEGSRRNLGASRAFLAVSAGRLAGIYDFFVSLEMGDAKTIPTSVLVPLYRDGLGFLISIGMREICRRCYSEKIPKAAFVGPVGAFRVSLFPGGYLYFSSSLPRRKIIGSSWAKLML